MKRFASTLLVSLIVFSPLFAVAQEFGEVGQFFVKISNFINSTLIPLVFGLALLVFIWGIFKFFILGGSEESKREEGKQLMMYAIIGFVLMVSIWGIVNLIAGGLGFSGQGIEDIPKAPGVQ
jgi:hypothetical protein